MDQNDECSVLGVLNPDPGAEGGRGVAVAVDDWMVWITVTRGFMNK